MRLYGELTKVEDQDDGTIKVYGIASTGARDDAGEVVLPEAMKAAIPDYMKFGAIREMHGASAAGTALTCEVDDEGRTLLSAHVVDPVAVQKVKLGVYKGFSIGGKVLARDPNDRTVITKIKLVENSLVDRPCNPEATIDLWKADVADLEDEEPMTTYSPPAEDIKKLAQEMADAAGKPDRRNDYVVKAREQLIAEHEAAAAAAPSEAIVEGVEKAAEVEGGGGPEAVEKTDPAEALTAMLDGALAKAEAPAEQPAPRVDTVALANAYDAIRKAVPQDSPATLAKGFYTLENTACVLRQLSYIAEAVFCEEQWEGDTQSKLPQAIADQMAAFTAFLVQMANEELAELLSSLNEYAPDLEVVVAGDDDVVELATKTLDLVKSDADLMEKAGRRNSTRDQANLQAAHDALVKAGAVCPESDKEAAAKAELAADRDRLSKALEEAGPKVEALLTKHAQEREQDRDALNKALARIEALEAQPAPSKVAKSSFAGVDRSDDAKGPEAAKPQADLSAEDVAKALAALPEQERVHLLMKAAMSQPIQVR